MTFVNFFLYYTYAKLYLCMFRLWGLPKTFIGKKGPDWVGLTRNRSPTGINTKIFYT